MLAKTLKTIQMFILKLQHLNLLSKDGRKRTVPCEHMNATFADRKIKKTSAAQQGGWNWDVNKRVAFCKTTRASKQSVQNVSFSIPHGVSNAKKMELRDAEPTHISTKKIG